VLYRSVVGDEVVFVESGTATLESVLGSVEATAGDYVVVPSGVTHRWVLDAPASMLVVEATGHVGPPARYLTAEGQLNESAPYSERDLRGPGGDGEAADLPRGEGAVDVFVRHAGGLTRHRYAHHPFDLVGWDGCVYPYALSIRDFEPIVKRFHAPPPVHQTFQGERFVLCSFCPRPTDFDPEAVPVPYSHSNADCDEVLFYWSGEFLSRKGAGVGAGSITFHPAGFVHGPQPGSVAASLSSRHTDEFAVMVDTFRPLRLGPAALDVEDSAYATSWQRGEA
jgi:homogentisate 1,2-dioxygenase